MYGLNYERMYTSIYSCCKDVPLLPLLPCTTLSHSHSLFQYFEYFKLVLHSHLAPQGLLNCVFFLNGKNFCLRRGAEHRDLKISQLKRSVVKLTGKHAVRYTYTEHVSKNRAGGLKQIKQANKTAPSNFQLPKADNEDFSDIDIKEFLQF